MKQTLTFDDVQLVPRYNTVASRLDVDLTTKLTKNITIPNPIVNSPMDTVIGDKLANIIIQNKGIPVFHRFCTRVAKEDWLLTYPNSFLSFGITSLDKFTIFELAYNRNLRRICIDTAHADSENVLFFIKSMKESFPDMEIIAGTVATGVATKRLIRAGATAVRVGIGTGSACITKNVTGHGVPQYTAIKECSRVARWYGVPIIADGGIRGSRDVVLALAAGASCVMIGKLFAETYESACKKTVIDDDIVYGSYRGQASAQFQKEFYGSVKEGTVPEGIASTFVVRKHAQEVIDELCGGIRSGLTYSGASNIKELRRRAKFIRVNGSYWK